MNAGDSACRIIFSPSTRAPPRPAPSCSMPRWRRSRPRSRNSRRSIRRPAWSSTIPRRSGRRRSRPCAPPWRRRASAPRTSPRSASPISARPRSSGTARPAGPSTTPSSGRTGAPPTPARRCGQGGHETAIAARTGLLLDPYFSATKIAWLLDHVEGARAAARAGRLAFGTVDSFLLWRLTGGKVHATDATNAARTLLLDIRSGAWDADLCELFGVPDGAAAGGARLRRRVRHDAPDLFGGPIRILGMAGDQQAATVGQGCFTPGMMKSTYGTGCFALLNTGDEPVASKNRLLTTIAYQLGGKRTYALEGAIFIAGAAVQWLRDALKVIGAAPDVNALAAAADPGRAGLSGAGLRRARRAVVGCAGARRAVRAHPQVRAWPSLRARRSRRSAIRPAICSKRCAPTGRRPGSRYGVAGRRRHGGERRHHAVRGRHPGGAGRPAGA